MTLFMVMGLPSSGKTTYAHNFCIQNPGVLYLGSDAIRFRMGKPKGDQSVRKEVWDYIEKTTREHLEVGWDVIIDGMLLNPKTRKRFIKIAREFGAEVEIHVMDTPLEMCLERNATRPDKEDIKVINRVAKRYKPPVRGDGEADRVYYVKPLKI